MKLRLITSSPSLELSGANVLVANLLDELQKRGCEAEWLCTGHQPNADGAWLGKRQFKIHSLPPTRLSAVRQRQQFLLDHVRRLSPCIYIPNFDFDMACAVPAIPPESAGVFIVHCDEPLYYDFVARHGRMFDSIVCVSRFVARKLQSEHPGWARKIIHIPFGVDCLERLPERRKLPSDPLKVAYCGRLSFYQKRIQDLAEVIRRCHAQQLPIQFSIAGTGVDETAFFNSIAAPIASGTANRLGLLSNPDTLDLLTKSDVLMMTSDFEGLPVVLLEGMSRGCIPVVSRINSGMAEVVRDGENGLLVPVGDVNGFVLALSRLAADPEFRLRLSGEALARIRTGGFTLTRAATEYENLFKTLINNTTRNSCERNGEPIIPRNYRLAARISKRINGLLKAASL